VTIVIFYPRCQIMTLEVKSNTNMMKE
jgi:hypothetical protein